MILDKEKIITNVASKLIEDGSKKLWESIKQYFTEINAHDEIDMGIAYEEYLKNTRNKNSKIKTLIYRHVPKELYSFYECIGVTCDGKVIDTSKVQNILDLGSKIVITGTGGIGKTTMLKHLFLNTIEETEFIPILVELRSVNTSDLKENSIYSLLYDNLVNNGFKMKEEHFKYSMERGAYSIFYDGYDEINKDKMQKVTQDILDIGNKFPLNRYILSSRPMEVFVGWNNYTEVESMELTKEQALSLIKKIEFDSAVKDVFYKELDERLYEKYRSFASNPLLLTIMLLTFDSRASIPDKLNDFYEQAFATLFNMHDATKEAYVRDIRCGLGCEDFKYVFAYICFKSYFNGDFEFTEPSLQRYLTQAKEKLEVNFAPDCFLEDLVQSVCMLVKEGINYRFSHRSFQEYFAAWYTCKLTDDVQKKLLTNWLKESDAVVSDSYFTMLYNLQSEKVNKIILCPGLKLLKTKVDKFGFSIELLNYLFQRLNIEIIEENEEKRYSISYTIKHRYLCNILRETCKLNDYNYPRIEVSGEQEIIQNILKNIRGERGTVKFTTIENAVSTVGEENIILISSWFESQIQFAFSVLDKYEKNSLNNKRKVASILEEL